MTIEVLSVGSLWIESRRNPSVVWNTTGVRVGAKVESRARQYGVVRLAASDANRIESRDSGKFGRWTSSQIGAHNGMRTLHLIGPADRAKPTDRVLAALRPDLVGTLDRASWDRNIADLISFSQWRDQQEVMLLMRAYAWVRGAAGTAILTPVPGGFIWDVRRW